jgi:hypothetical protein
MNLGGMIRFSDSSPAITLGAPARFDLQPMVEAMRAMYYHSFGNQSWVCMVFLCMKSGASGDGNVYCPWKIAVY